MIILNRLTSFWKIKIKKRRDNKEDLDIKQNSQENRVKANKNRKKKFHLRPIIRVESLVLFMIKIENGTKFLRMRRKENFSLNKKEF